METLEAADRIRSTDVLVVGNGVVGSSIAYELMRRRAGLSVTVVGPAARAGAASTAAGAMHNTFAEVTSTTLASAAGTAKLELCVDALDRWGGWLEELIAASGHADLPDTARAGTTVLLNTRSGELDNETFDAMVTAAREYVEPHEEVDPRAVPGLSPAEHSRPLRALHLPREGSVDARAVLAALGAAAARTGARYVDAEADRVLVQDGRAVGVQLADGRAIAAGTVVLAAGAHTGRLLDGALPPGAVPLQLAGKGIAFLVTRPPGAGFSHVVRTPTRSGSCGLHLVPLGDGVEYLGATNVLLHDPTTGADLGMSDLLVRAMCAQLDRTLVHAQMQRWLVGNRPVSLDGFPLVGRTSVADLLVVTGTYRDGFHCSPVLAEVIVDDIVGKRAVAERLPLFTPERPPIVTRTREQSADDFVLHGVSGFLEGGAEMPGHDTSALEFFHRTLVDRFYDQLDEPLGLAPEMVAACLVGAGTPHPRLSEYLTQAHRHHGAW